MVKLPRSFFFILGNDAIDLVKVPSNNSQFSSGESASGSRPSFYLNLSNTEIGDEGAEAFAAVIRSDTSTDINLNFANTKITDKGASALADALKDKGKA